MTLTARPRLLIRFAVLAAMALCGIVLALSSTGTPPVGAQDGSLPAKPTGVVATATHDSVALAWDDPSDASITHYQIFRRDRGVHDTGEFVTIEENTGSAAASYTDDTVEPETRYVYRVKAVNQHGASTWSDFVRADTPAAPDPADLAPSGLEVSLVENRVTLTWDAPASDAASVTGYEILRRRPNDGEAALTTLVADTGNAETGYTDDTANEPGVRYTYRVKALRDGEQSKVSNYARIDLPDDYAQDTPEPEEEPSPEALAPSGLTAEAAEDGGVALSWTAPAEDAGSVTGYEVLRAQGSAELATLAADTGSTDTAYTDSGVTGDLDDYRYQVKALRGGDASQGSNVAGVLQSAHAGAIVPLADVTLISNIEQTSGGAGNFTNDQAQAFTTGSNSGGYSLTKVVIESRLNEDADFTVSVHENDSGAPGTSLGTLTKPTLPVVEARGDYEFTHSGIDLAASTTYFIVVDVSTSSTNFNIYNTGSDAEDTGGATGWSIGDSSLYRGFGSTGSWTTWAESKKISITGTVKGGTTNSDATGAPTITGTPAVGELLTADISNIGDADGIADADFEYQWIAFDGTTDSDISGATGETYRPLLAHVGQTIKVRVSFDDDDDNAESLTSAATAAVTASTYGQVIWAATLTVEEETLAAGTFFGYAVFTRGSLEPISFTHDGLTLFVSILQYLEGAQLRWEFSGGSLGSEDFNLYLDGAPFLIESPGTDTFLTFSDHGLTWTDEQEVEVRLTVNRPATGAPAITGKPEVGETLTAGIRASWTRTACPSAAQFAYQWISNDGTDDSDIDGATDSTYTLVEADAGKSIKVRVSFTDNAKFPESLTSAATAAVTVPVAALVSNVGQTAAGNANVTATQSQGQGFTTGSDSGGYTLGSVELAVSSFSGTASDITVSIYSESSDDPGTVVHTLTTPASISTPVTTFTAPSGTTLAANTTYYVVISTTGSGINLSRTDATAEDTGGASGWSIADSGRVFASNAWRTTTSPIRMRVNDAAATTSTGIWSATLTVAIGGSFYGYSSISGDGDLEPAEFTYNGNPAEVQVLAYSGNVFYLQTSPALDSGDYFLFLDDTPIQLGAASGSPLRHQVSDHGLTWTADQQVEVRLALNNAPTGEPVITGTPVVSQTLTADISGIMDADGRPADDQFSYQWIRSDGATDSDISGATNATYKLGSADLDKTIKVRVTFTDGGGFPERLTSDATGPVTPLTVSSDWSLVPSGLGPGDRFRLMFISSATRTAEATDIATYNTWVQGLAANGHTDIQDHSSTFRVVGSTAAVDARDNTGTTGTGVPIHWLGGDKVADDYEDFYDEDWDEEASIRDESGTTVIPILVFTGSNHDGTKTGQPLGTNVVTEGIPNSTIANHGPLSSDTSGASTSDGHLYALSGVFEVSLIITEVPADWSLVPSGLQEGDQFRLLFLSSATRTAEATDIATYNTWVQGLAANGHTDIQDHSSTFRVVGSTAAVDARDNTGTTGTGVPIHWLGGDKVADDYEDFYDEDWDEEASIRDESGTTVIPILVFTGSNHDGTKTGQPLGTNVVTEGIPNSTIANHGPLSSDTSGASTDDGHLYGLSGVFRVVAGSNTPATGKPTISGTPQVNQTLTADISSIMDADGLPAAAQFSYQWISDDSDIDGATDSTYTLVEADAGKTITVRVSFTDNANNPESLTSAPTVTVLEMVVPEVPADWSLVPSGLVVGDQFRLIFVSSTGRDASSESIDAYNTWIQSLAAAGHTDIQRYSSTFTVVGSTAADDARDNTAPPIPPATRACPSTG